MIAIVIITIIILSIISPNFLVTKLEEAWLPLSQSGLFYSHITWTLVYNPGLSWPSKNLSFVAGPWPLLNRPGIIFSLLLEKLHERYKPVQLGVPGAPLLFLLLLAKALIRGSDGRRWISLGTGSKSQPGQTGLSLGWEPELALPTGKETGHPEMKQSFSSLEKSLEESLAQSVASTSREKCHEKGCFYGMWPTQQGPPELSWLSLFSAVSLPIILFSFALSSLLNDIPVLSQQFQEQNLGETFCSLLVWGTHPLLC